MKSMRPVIAERLDKSGLADLHQIWWHVQTANRVIKNVGMHCYNSHKTTLQLIKVITGFLCINNNNNNKTSYKYLRVSNSCNEKREAGWKPTNICFRCRVWHIAAARSRQNCRQHQVCLLSHCISASPAAARRFVNQSSHVRNEFIKCLPLSPSIYFLSCHQPGQWAIFSNSSREPTSLSAWVFPVGVWQLLIGWATQAQHTHVQCCLPSVLPTML